MKRTNPSLTRRVGAAGLAMLAITVAACTKKEEESLPSLAVMPRVEVTSVAGDTTSALLAAIYARALENSGVRVVRKDPVDLDRAGYVQALLNGQFQMIPDTSRGLLQFVLADTPTGSTEVPTTEAQTATTRAPITIPTTVPATTTPDTSTPDSGASTSAAATTAETTVPATTEAPATTAAESTSTTIAPTNGHSGSAQLVAINSSIDSKLLAYGATIAEQRTVVACTADYMKAQAAYQLYTLTDLASLAPSTRFAAPAAFQADTAEGLPQLLAVYAPEFQSVQTIEADGFEAAIDAGSADCFAIDSLDPLITSKKLTVLFDDQYMVPMNVSIALMSSTAATPEVTAALDAVAGALSTSKFNQLLREVLDNGGDITTVANAFVDNISTGG
ncbi:MAG TPA: glycine betaine ABC transporter substrate-binding protein [Ilumatobacteraceae bacterium]|nr:glycine betaine ABC transporter substrate-binding protein [Ilumatobacteraceae bacterium]